MNRARTIAALATVLVAAGCVSVAAPEAATAFDVAAGHVRGDYTAIFAIVYGLLFAGIGVALGASLWDAAGWSSQTGGLIGGVAGIVIAVVVTMQSN